MGLVGKKARFICDLNTGFQLNLELNTLNTGNDSQRVK